MTGQSLLNLIELFDQENQLQPGEADVTRGLLALNVAQDYFEAQVARRTKVLVDQVGTVTTTASAESTPFPAGLMRVDRMQYLDPTTSLPMWDLDVIKKVGGQTRLWRWPFALVAPQNISGKPRGYWTNGRNIYWDPIPDTTYTIRWYGFKSADDITADGTFAYPDEVAAPIASFAATVLRVGLGDDANETATLANQIFDPVIDNLSRFNRDGAEPFEYRYTHLT